MKMKIAIASLAVIAVVVASFAFTTNKKVTQKLFYKKNIGLTRGPIDGTSQLIQSEVTDVTSWGTSGATDVTGSYLNSITFDQEPNDVSDGISDGQYSKAEAIQEVWNEYVKVVGGAPQYQLPTNSGSFTPSTSGASAITVGRDSSN